MIVYDLPLRLGFRGIRRRQGVLIEGPAGWGDWCPFPEYDDAESVPWLRAAHEAATIGFPSPVRQRVPVNGIVPAIPADQVPQRVRSSGCSTIKVKVAAPGQSLADDIDRVAMVRQVLPDANIRIDANGAWDVATAETALLSMAHLGLEYAEQPCASTPDLAELRRRLGGAVAIAADESIRRAVDPLLVRDLAAADVVVLKVAPLGGVRACLELAAQLELPVVVSSAIETSVGLSAGLALAASLPQLDHACGLETGNLLECDVAAEPLIPQTGWLGLRSVAPDKDLLAAARADAETTRWWLARLRRVSKLAGVELP